MRESTPKHNKMVVPLKSCTICHDDEKYLNVLKENIENIGSEVNCLEFKFKKLSDNVSVYLEPDRKIIGQTFRKEAINVMNMLESFNDEYLKQVLEGTKKIQYKSNNYDITLDQQFYKLSKVPKTTGITDNHSLTGGNLWLSQISQDLMVTIDHTYDSVIHLLYQAKRIHSMIQKIRKTMNLRPWDIITVFLDEQYTDQYIQNKLKETLNNTQIIVSKISEMSMFQTLDDDVYEIERDIMCIETFEPEEYPENCEKSREYTTGKLIVLYTKP